MKSATPTAQTTANVPPCASTCWAPTRTSVSHRISSHPTATANDNFEVPCLETTYNNNVRIFNRWGDKVFEKDGYANDWDGRYKGNNLPPGTYFYLVQLEKGKSNECLQGYFTIPR